MFIMHSRKSCTCNFMHNLSDPSDVSPYSMHIFIHICSKVETRLILGIKTISQLMKMAAAYYQGVNIWHCFFYWNTLKRKIIIVNWLRLMCISWLWTKICLKLRNHRIHLLAKRFFEFVNSIFLRCQRKQL